MKIRLFSLLILLSLAIGLAVPTGQAAAEGARRIDFTATSTPGCAPDPGWCSPGEYQVLPNGKTFLVGMKGIMTFTASDPRWDAICYYAGDPFPPGGGAFPAKGSFTCYATDPEYAGGWWEGNISQTYMPDKMLSVWTAKGFGTLDHLQVIVHQVNSQWYENTPTGVTDIGVITELPGYQQ